jgi:hypothetical protein
MKPCARCHRHLRTFEAPCPFCGQENRFAIDRSVLAVGLGLAVAGSAACGPKEDKDSTSDTSSDDGGSYYAGPSTLTETTTTGQTTTTVGPTTTTVGPTTVDPTSTDEGGSYYAGPSTLTEATETGTETGTTSDSSSSDDGGSYYAGAASKPGVVWEAADPAKR